SAFALVISWQLGFGADAERVDVQQRLRVAVETLLADLSQAGGGARDARGTAVLGLTIPAVLPYRLDGPAADVPGTVRTDAITILSAPSGAIAQTTMRLPMAARSGDASIETGAGCSRLDAFCGFTPGKDVVVFDETGSFDTFR